MADIKVIKMARIDDGTIDDAPREADVHPDEVANWQQVGWQIVSEPEPTPEPTPEPIKPAPKKSSK